MTDLILRMNANFVNITGNRYGRWTVLSYIGKNKKRHVWLCRCDCGKEKVIYSGHLKNGATKSCGCLHKEIISTHKQTKTKEYRAWATIKRKCLNSKDKRYPDYGGRGITVCDRWLNSFENFIEDMGMKPTPIHSIDRINNNGNYEPSNCRWATPKEQARNTRFNRTIEYKGDTMCISEIAEKYGMSHLTLRSRLSSGWSVERALSTPIGNYRK